MATADTPGLEPLAAQPFLPRPEVVERLASCPAQLVLLVAPSGSGKSMALLAFARALARRGEPCHWSDPDGLAAAPRGATLLIDGGLRPEDATLQYAAMTGVLARVPRQRILIALAGPLPPLLRDEWIAGRAAVITARDLALGPEEAGALFGEASTSREVRLLHQFTEGWPLGLGLLSRDPDQAFALVRRDGNARPLPRSLSLWFDDWLARSVDAPVQRLLMDLAVFERFPAALLPALPGLSGDHGMSLLRVMLDDGLFLHDCNRQPGWFCLMPAFARHLRDRLNLYHPDRADQIRRFAVSWSASNHDASSEMRHGLAVWSPEEVIARVDAAGAIAVSLARGPDMELPQPISAASARTTPLTFFGRIYERIRLGAFDEARVHHANAAALTEGFTRFESQQDPEQIQGWIKVFSAVVQISDDTWIDDHWRASFHADLRDAISRAPVLAMSQSTVMMLMALNAGAREEVLSIGRLALQLQERSHADKAAIFVHLHRASALIASARLEEARDAIQSGQKLAADNTYADSYELISCQIHAGLCAFESGDTDTARALLEPCHEHFSRIHGWRRNWLDYFAAMAEITFQTRGGAAADLWVMRGMELAAQRGQPQLALGLALMQIDLSLRNGQTEGIADAWTDLSLRLQAADPVAPQIHHLAQLVEVEFLLARGLVPEAASRFSTLDRGAIAAHDLRLALRAAVLALELARLSADPDAMLTAVAQVVALAPGLPRLARQAQVQNRLRLTLEGLLAQGIDPGREIQAYGATLTPRGRSLLSPRESQIIGMIADGLSNKEIARVLGTSEGTVKSHRKNLYEKLNVSSRSKAIARARDLGLVQGV